jgi:predicted MPP superfamily phosphohydrolase
MSWFLRMVLIVLPLLALAYGYVGSRLGAAVLTLTGWPRTTVRRLIPSIIAVMNLYILFLLIAYLLQKSSLITALRGGSAWGDALAFPFWAGLIICVELLPLLLVMDLLRIPLYKIFQRHKQRWLNYQATMSIVLAVGLALYVAIRIANDTFSLRLSQKDVKITDLPAELDGFRIVHLSDLQADPYTDAKKMQRYVDLANAQRPELVLFAGDVVTSGTDYINAGAEMLGQVRARLGVYACQGDHDYWANPALVAQALRRHGVHVIEDSVLTISGSTSKLSLTVLTNVYQRRPSPEKLRALLKQRPNAAIHLLLTHQPSGDIVGFAEKNDYGIVAAGHTHGGQVVFRFFGFPLNASMFETDYVSGFFQAGKALVSVTNGLGLTIAPVRYQAPAEVTLLTLRRAN